MNFNFLSKGDLVKVTGFTNVGGIEKEAIKIGTICKVINADVDCDCYEIIPLNRENDSCNERYTFWYYGKDLEKGLLTWAKITNDSYVESEEKEYYIVRVVETMSKSVKVKARSSCEAQEIVDNARDKGIFIIEPEDIEDCEFFVRKPDKDNEYDDLNLYEEVF